MIGDKRPRKKKTIRPEGRGKEHIQEKHYNSWVVSMRMDIRTVANLARYLLKDGFVQQGKMTSAEVIRMILYAVEEQNVPEEERIMKADEALEYLQLLGVSTVQARQQSVHRLSSQIRIESKTELQTMEQWLRTTPQNAETRRILHAEYDEIEKENPHLRGKRGYDTNGREAPYEPEDGIKGSDLIADLKNLTPTQTEEMKDEEEDGG